MGMARVGGGHDQRRFPGHRHTDVLGGDEAEYGQVAVGEDKVAHRSRRFPRAGHRAGFGSDRATNGAPCLDLTQIARRSHCRHPPALENTPHLTSNVALVSSRLSLGFL